MPETTKNTQKLNLISAAEATRKLQTKFPYLPNNIGCGFLRYMIPNVFTGKNIYFNIGSINYLMEKIKATDKDTDENVAVNKFINDVVALKVTFKPKRWYSLQDVALKVDGLKLNGKPHFGFESQQKVIDSVSNWLRAHQDRWFDEKTDSFSRIDVPNNGRSFKILVTSKLLDKMFNAYIARDTDPRHPFGNEPELPVLTTAGLAEVVNTGKECDDMVDGEPTFLLNVKGVKFPMKRSSCLNLLNRYIAKEHIDSIQVTDSFNLTVNETDLKELIQSIIKRL